MGAEDGMATTATTQLTGATAMGRDMTTRGREMTQQRHFALSATCRRHVADISSQAKKCCPRKLIFFNRAVLQLQKSKQFGISATVF